MDRDEILRGLEERLGRARDRRDRADARFEEATTGIPSGIPYPDSLDRIASAAREYSRSNAEVNAILLAKSNFLLHGTIPPDFAGPKGEGDS